MLINFIKKDSGLIKPQTLANEFKFLKYFIWFHVENNI